MSHSAVAMLIKSARTTLAKVLSRRLPGSKSATEDLCLMRLMARER